VTEPVSEIQVYDDSVSNVVITSCSMERAVRMIENCKTGGVVVGHALFRRINTGTDKIHANPQ
jgi:hypothetical protein